jgi:hypothetical protein
LLGSNDDIVAGANKAQDAGWTTAQRNTYRDVNGFAEYGPDADNFAVINSVNCNIYNAKGSQGRETYRNPIEKLALTIMHETGHPQFKDLPGMESDGHFPQTIMDARPDL